MTPMGLCTDLSVMAGPDPTVYLPVKAGHDGELGQRLGRLT